MNIIKKLLIGLLFAMPVMQAMEMPKKAPAHVCFGNLPMVFKCMQKIKVYYTISKLIPDNKEIFFLSDLEKATWLSQESLQMIKNTCLAMGLKKTLKVMNDDDDTRFIVACALADDCLMINSKKFVLLTLDEQKYIIAHECAHIANHDSAKSTLYTIAAPCISYFSLQLLTKHFPALDILNNLATYQFINTLVTKKLSQMQEYGADLAACKKFNCAKHAITTLEKLETLGNLMVLFFNPSYKKEDMNELIKPSNLLLWLINGIVEGFFEEFFSTHPTIEQRINVCKKLIAEQEIAETSFNVCNNNELEEKTEQASSDDENYEINLGGYSV